MAHMGRFDDELIALEKIAKVFHLRNDSKIVIGLLDLNLNAIDQQYFTLPSLRLFPAKKEELSGKKMKIEYDGYSGQSVLEWMYENVENKFDVDAVRKQMDE